MARQSFLLSFLLTLVALHGIHAVEYVVTNNAPKTPGGIRFNKELGVEYTKKTMASASDFIWKLFQQHTKAERKHVPRVSLSIEDTEEIEHAVNSTEIQIGAGYIQGIKGDIKWGFNGVVYHEMAHIWQWLGNGQAPSGLIEGIADYVRLKANYAPANWVKPGQGKRWDQGFDVTARFLEYCDGLRHGFVAELNKKLKNGYSDKFFVELLGKTVDQLWKDYKAKYGN